MSTRLIAILVLLIVGLTACGGRETYPRLSDVPERPEPSLTPERSHAVSEELGTAREEARRHATEGRPASESSEAEGVVMDTEGATGDALLDDAGTPRETEGQETE